ncbi:TB2/DP1/HVA22-related protein [Artemisia annua]|uniref:HVA22-like protein n=1 Tax=Artemisia annua TaxID=35608 RepID=A0A2U1P371_ARTAN|nr:TB2/DP1/HVA22-related protein [Artemisia annua]
MLGYMLNRILVLLLAYLYPAYECFKNIEKNKPDVDQLRFWCQYWILIALMTVWDPFGDAFVGWLPMYSEAKLVLCVYLWHPKTMGTKSIYQSFVKPYVSKHEAEIDRTLMELKTRAGDSATLYCSRVLVYGQTRAFEILQMIMAQAYQRPQAPPATAAPQDSTQTAAASAARSSAVNTDDAARNRLKKTGATLAQ